MRDEINKKLAVDLYSLTLVGSRQLLSYMRLILEKAQKHRRVSNHNSAYHGEKNYFNTKKHCNKDKTYLSSFNPTSG